MSKVWGYILDAPGRPAQAVQREALALLGADVSEFGTVWCDKIKRGSTRPRGQLVEREAMLHAAQAGDTLVIAAPFCIGLSEKDAAWFLGELSALGIAVIVNGDLVRLEPGADHSDMVRRVASAQNVHHVRQAKRRAAKS